MKNSSKPVSASTEGEVVYNGMKPAYPTKCKNVFRGSRSNQT